MRTTTGLFTGAVMLCSILLWGGPVLAQEVPADLGALLYFDQNLSVDRNLACAGCHAPSAGFADPDPSTPVSGGSVPGAFGNRNAPSAAYAALSPFFYWNGTWDSFVGGQFWDGRANTLADQAAQPILNPVEMGMPDKLAVVQRLLENPTYIDMFQSIYDLDLNVAVQTDPGVEYAYRLTTLAIGEFEKTQQFTIFSSKFDSFMAKQAKLTRLESKGLKLFMGKGGCVKCHALRPTTAPDGSSTMPSVLTNHRYQNLGLPVNVVIAELAGPQPTDYGLGGRTDIEAIDPQGLQKGKFKIPTLRNVEKTPPYGHNGVFSSLEQVVHFLNTRDVLGVCSDNLDPGFGITCWPLPEVPENMSQAVGDLHLTAAEEAALVAFLKTLTDGYGPSFRPPYMPPLP